MKKKLKSDGPLDAATCSPSSDTPETDHRAYVSIQVTIKGHSATGPTVVEADFARKLERERDALRNALRRLYDAADVYAASQERATDERIGLVQPITVADGNNLIAALSQSVTLLQDAERTGWIYSENSFYS